MGILTIMFRAKTEDGKWVYGAYVSKNWYPTVEDGDDEISGVVVEESNIISYDEECLWHKVIPETVGQYTGLIDKNGKKIFEGDVVKLALMDCAEIGVIKFNDIMCRFMFYDKCGGYGIDNTCDFEVIGNIHDNPELLKGGGEG